MSKSTSSRTPRKSKTPETIPIISAKNVERIKFNAKTMSIILGQNCRKCMEKLFRHLNLDKNFRVEDLSNYLELLEDLRKLSWKHKQNGGNAIPTCMQCGAGYKHRKHQGINPKNGMLKKGFIYTGKFSKTGLPLIKKV